MKIDKQRRDRVHAGNYVVICAVRGMDIIRDEK